MGFLTVVSAPQTGLFGGYLVLNWAGRPLEFHCTAPVKPNRAQQILYGPTLEPYLYGEQIGRTLLSKTQHPPLLICTDIVPALAVRQYVDWPVVLVLPSQAGNPPQPQAAESSEVNGGVLDTPRNSSSLTSLCAADPSQVREEKIVDFASPTPAWDRAEDVSPCVSPLVSGRGFAEAAGDQGVYWRLDHPHPGLGRLRGFCWGRQRLAVLENLQEDYPRVQEVLAGLDETFDLAEPFCRIREAIEEARRGG
ncbi:MAG TPA: hypothetical protein PLQ00_04555 [Thermoguttaceae bacterium]|nr:hypothetical protein [Thermoguttaceae bacterium]